MTTPIIATENGVWFLTAERRVELEGQAITALASHDGEIWALAEGRRRRLLAADHRLPRRRPPGADGARPSRPGSGRRRARAGRQRRQRRDLVDRARGPARRLWPRGRGRRRNRPPYGLDRPVHGPR